MRALGLVVPTVAALCEMRYLWRTPHALANARLRGADRRRSRTRRFPRPLRAALARSRHAGAARAPAPAQAALSLR